jgi:hypothetical protein
VIRSSFPVVSRRVDRSGLLTFPTILGTGERFFPPDRPPAYLECLAAEQAGPAVLARYGRPSL